MGTAPPCETRHICAVYILQGGWLYAHASLCQHQPSPLAAHRARIYRGAYVRTVHFTGGAVSAYTNPSPSLPLANQARTCSGAAAPLPPAEALSHGCAASL